MVAFAACGAPKSGSSAASAGATSTSCTKDGLKTLTAGKFTVGTDNPAYEPWFSANTPSNGAGYESAVAYAVAGKLGFSEKDVAWVKVPFNSAFAPGPKKFDVDVNQISINEARRKAVDFSSGYYDVAQAVVTYAGSPITKKRSINDLRGANLGAQVGTTSYTAVTEQLKPKKQAKVYDTNDQVTAALKSKLIDGGVFDLPTALTVAATVPGMTIVGQLPPAGKPEQFGIVLAKGSGLTQCVSHAVDQLRTDGTLKRLEEQWLTRSGAPKLK